MAACGAACGGGGVCVGGGGWLSLLRGGLVMAFPLVAAGGGARGGVRRWQVGVVGVAGGLRVVCQWSGPGGGRGGDGVGVALLVAGGGRGSVLCWMGASASSCVLWVLCVRVVRVSQSLAGRGVQTGGGCLGIQVGLWSVGSGRLLVDCVRRYGWRLRGVPVVVGYSV